MEEIMPLFITSMACKIKIHATDEINLKVKKHLLVYIWFKLYFVKQII